VCVCVCLFVWWIGAGGGHSQKQPTGNTNLRFRVRLSTHEFPVRKKSLGEQISRKRCQDPLQIQQENAYLLQGLLVWCKSS